MSKSGFSFGLKKNPSAKPTQTRLRRGAFGDANDGPDDDEGAKEPIRANGAQLESITELDAFGRSVDSGTIEQESEIRQNKTYKNGLKAEPPPRKSRIPNALSRSAEDGAPPKPSSSYADDLSSAVSARRLAEAASAQDPSIYDYDAVYDSFKLPTYQKSAGNSQASGPRYFTALQRAAEIRERDRKLAEEKRLKRERDAEGAEFADKEAFVTEAYKKQQEENRRLEEEEKQREKEEEKKRKEGRGMAGFYAKILTRDEELHAEKVRAADERAREVREGNMSKEGAENDEKDKTDADLAREINAQGGNVVLNEDGEVVDKRQLLKGGLNVAAPKKKAAHTSAKSQYMEREGEKDAKSGSGRAKGVFLSGGKQAMRARQTRMLEAQLEESLKRAREDEEIGHEKIEVASKSRKTEAEISSAKERYLARKRIAEAAKKEGYGAD